jgi:hypothetical protein
VSYIDPYPEVEFRDGVRVVPPHVAAILRDIDTFALTFEEAIQVANQKMTRDYLAKVQRDAISGHFREHR